MTTDAEYIAYGESIPCDEELLEPIGRVVWSAIRLQHSVRDLIGAVGGRLSSTPFDSTLGGSITALRKAAVSLNAQDRRLIEDWCDGTGTDAKNARDSVLHATSYTEADGKQAIKQHGRHGSDRFKVDDLNIVAGRIEMAGRKLNEASSGVKRPW